MIEGVSKTMTPAAYMRKSGQALSSARQLLATGDADGACNRAYYAMFDAAHAALLAAKVEAPTNATKTHRGLISAFGHYLVMGGHVAAELGGALNKVERLRLLADYTGDPVSNEDAAWAVEQAHLFDSAIRHMLSAVRNSATANSNSMDKDRGPDDIEPRPKLYPE